MARAVGRRPGSGGIQSVRPQLVAAHISFVSERCAEVSLHVRYGDRSRAVAARFELIRDRWQVCALEFAWKNERAAWLGRSRRVSTGSTSGGWSDRRSNEEGVSR